VRVEPPIESPTPLRSLTAPTGLAPAGVRTEQSHTYAARAVPSGGGARGPAPGRGTSGEVWITGQEDPLRLAALRTSP